MKMDKFIESLLVRYPSLIKEPTKADLVGLLKVAYIAGENAATERFNGQLAEALSPTQDEKK